MDKLKKCFFFLTLLTLAIIAFYPIWSEVAVTLLFIFGIIAGYTNGLPKITKQKSVLPLLMLAFFVIVAFSLIVSSNKADGIDNLHTYIPFVALPVLALLHQNNLSDNKIQLLKVLSGGIMAASAICLVLAVWRSFYLIDGHVVFNPYIGYRNQFVYTYLSVFQYTNTFAMMTVFVVAAMIWALMFRDVKHHKWMIYTAIGLSILMIFLLSSRTNVYALFAVLYYSVVIFYIRFKKLIHSLLLLVGVTGLFWVFQTCNYRVMNLSQTVTSYITEEDVTMDNGYVIKHPEKIENVNIRFQMWETGFKIAKRYWLQGCGIGDFKNMLHTEYGQDGIQEAYEKGYDQHNQYLETLGTTGILGFLMLLAIMGYALYQAWRHRNYLLFCSLLTLALNMLLESMFNRYSGSLFFVLSLLLASAIGGETQKVDEADIDKSSVTE